MSGDTTSAQSKGELSSKAVISASRSLLLSCLSGFLYSCCSAIVKHMTNIHPAQILCYGFCIITSMCLPQIVWRGDSILGPADCRKVIYLRSVAACVAALLRAIACRHLPLGEATVIAASYPAFTAIVAKIFLKESFGLLQVISVVFTVIGMILVSGLDETMTQNSSFYTTESISGLAAAFGSVLCTALYFTLTRRTKHVHNSVLLFTTGVATVIESLAVLLVLDEFRLVYCGLHQFLIISIGVFSYFSSVAVIIAVQNMNAGPVTIVRAASDIFFSFLWQVILSHDIPNSTRILGAVLVSLSIVLVQFSRQIKACVPKRCVKFC